MDRQQRRDERFQVGLAARLSSDAVATRAVTVTNVSKRGCRFNLPGDPLGAGSALTMAFGRAGSLDARVQWRAGNAYGVRFEQPLASAALDHIRLFLSEQPALVAERDGLAAVL